MGKRVLATGRSQRESAWRDRLARYTGSEQTVGAFCRSEAVSVATFYAWRARLRAGEVTVTQAQRTAPAPFIDLGSVRRRAANTSVSSRANASGYAPHVAPHVAPPRTRSAIDIRLELGDGVVLHIARH